MKVFIRADGGEGIGLGHIMRMLALASELKKTNEVIFLCKGKKYKKNYNDNIEVENNINDKFRTGIDKIKENDFKILEIDEENIIEDIIDLQVKYKADLLITDSYDVDEKYFNKLKPYFKLTGYIDDVNNCRMNVDFIINQNINAEDLDYSKSVNKNTKLFLGTRYCMLRSEFKEDFNRKNMKKNCLNVLLTLGGMDKEHNTIKILKEIVSIDVNIDVTIGSAFSKELEEEIVNMSKEDSNIRVYRNAKMSSLMNTCDIAISACGSTLYELSAMKVPTIGIIIADNQELVAKKMKEKSLILNAYYMDDIGGEKLYHDLNRLINNKELRDMIIKNQSNLVNINGTELLLEEIIKIYNSKKIIL